MTDKELIKALRDLSAGPSSYLQDMGNAAADRIEQLVATNEALVNERDEALEWLSASQGYIADAVYALDKQEKAEAKLAATEAIATQWKARAERLEGNAPEQHWDDHCVNQFSKMMREKMALSRAKGRSGWNDPNQCSVQYLRELLYEHLDKGDPVDVANICMMLRHYDASTARDYGNTLDMLKHRADAAEAKVGRLVEALRELRHRWYLGDLQEKDFAAALPDIDTFALENSNE